MSGTPQIPDRPPVLGPRVPRRGNRFSRAVGRLLLRLFGWRVVGSPPDTEKFIIVAAPHTSNWDGLLFLIASVALGMELHWIGKHTLFRGWRGRLLRWLGGVPVDRGAAADVVEQIARRFAENDRFVLVLAPEGTRALATRWKTGFSRMAAAAGVPVVLGFMDYRSKRLGFGPVLPPDMPVEQQLRRMAEFYRQVTPKFPEQFQLPQ